MLKFLYQTVDEETFLNLQKMFCAKEELPLVAAYKGEVGEHADKLEFITVLGNAYRSQTKTVTESMVGTSTKTKKTVTSYMPCGIKLRTKVDLEIPVLPTLTEAEASVDFNKYRVQQVNAGETFVLSYAAAVFLLTQPYFAGTIKGKGMQPDVILRVRYNSKSDVYRAYFSYKRESKAAKVGALKDTLEVIGSKDDEDGMVYLFEEYIETFSSLGLHSSYQKTRRYRNKDFAVTNKKPKAVELPKRGVGKYMVALTGKDK